MLSFFDVEGNPVKMDLIPIAARLFVAGAISPMPAERIVDITRDEMLAGGSQYFFQQWPFLRDVKRLTWERAIDNRLAISFDADTAAEPRTHLNVQIDHPQVEWNSSGESTHSGRFIVNQPNAAVFIGFAKGEFPIDLGSASIDKLNSPFASIVLTPAEAGQSIASARRLLLTVAAREGSTGMQWNATHTSVGDQWGKAPPLIETVSATISLPSSEPLTVFALTPEGNRASKVPTRMEKGRAIFELGSQKTIWYELIRE